VRPSPSGSYNPAATALARSYATTVWALPRSLAATEGILSFPQGTEMFQFPRFPTPSRELTGHHACRVAPFGHLWIAGCQRLPRAFRRVATSFIGVQRQGIHRVPIIPVAPRATMPSIQLASFPAGTSRQAAACHQSRAGHTPTGGLFSYSPTRLVPGGPIHHRPIHLSRYRRRWSRGGSNPEPPPCKGGALPVELRPHRNGPVGAPGLEPGTSALSGPRSNQLSYAPAACYLRY
jgi:hypothetical protein